VFYDADCAPDVDDKRNLLKEQHFFLVLIRYPGGLNYRSL